MALAVTPTRWVAKDVVFMMEFLSASMQMAENTVPTDLANQTVLDTVRAMEDTIRK